MISTTMSRTHLIRLGSFCIDMNGKLLHFYYTYS